MTPSEVDIFVRSQTSTSIAHPTDFVKGTRGHTHVFGIAAAAALLPSKSKKSAQKGGKRGRKYPKRAENGEKVPKRRSKGTQKAPKPAENRRECGRGGDWASVAAGPRWEVGSRDGAPVCRPAASTAPRETGDTTHAPRRMGTLNRVPTVRSLAAFAACPALLPAVLRSILWF